MISNEELVRRRYGSAEGSINKPLHKGNRLWIGVDEERWIRMDCGVDVRHSLTSTAKDGIELLGYCQKCFGKRRMPAKATILEFPDVQAEAAG